MRKTTVKLDANDGAACNTFALGLLERGNRSTRRNRCVSLEPFSHVLDDGNYRIEFPPSVKGVYTSSADYPGTFTSNWKGPLVKPVHDIIHRIGLQVDALFAELGCNVYQTSISFVYYPKHRAYHPDPGGVPPVAKHTDKPAFGHHIAAVHVFGEEPATVTLTHNKQQPQQCVSLETTVGVVYTMSDAARWEWAHSIQLAGLRIVLVYRYVDVDSMIQAAHATGDVVDPVFKARSKPDKNHFPGRFSESRLQQFYEHVRQHEAVRADTRWLGDDPFRKLSAAEERVVCDSYLLLRK